MTWEYSEAYLIENTAIDLFHTQLGWDTALAFNKETFGDGSTLGRIYRNTFKVCCYKDFLNFPSGCRSGMGGLSNIWVLKERMFYLKENEYVNRNILLKTLFYLI